MGSGGASAEPFGALLRRRRRAAGLTQEGLAERAGLSVRGVSDLERGARRAPQRETVRRLARALGLRPAGVAALEAGAAAARGGGAAPRGAAGPAPDAGTHVPHNLPLHLTSFVGRERDLAAVRERLLSVHRLVTLTGPGGIGKTRLALHIAAAMREAFPDGVWLTELAPLADAALVSSAVAASVGVQEVVGHPLLATLIEALHDRCVLLVLDNCEHLLDACARLTDALLRACPGLTALATSREPLGLPGETVWRLPTLSAPAVGESSTADGLLHYDAARLFIARAAAADATFAVTPGNAAALARICRRLDGLPLALELAAARVTALSPEDLADRLDDRFRLLTGGTRTAPPRQQTLRAALDWSYDLLSDAERAVFRRLSVFQGGCLLEAAEAVCAGATGTPASAGVPVAPGEVLDLVARLVEQSLVQRELAGPATRYRLLETVRAYGRERLCEAGEEDAAHDRLRSWCVADVRAASAPTSRGAGAVRRGSWTSAGYAVDRLVAEEDNARAALTWCLEAAPAAGLELAAELGPFWHDRAAHDEGARWLEALLARAAEGEGAAPAASGTDGRRARALYWLGRLVREVGETERARAPLAESVALFRRLRDDEGTALALEQLGQVARADGRPEEARGRFEEALAAFGRAGGARFGALIRRDLGLLWLSIGDLVPAKAAFAEYVAISRQLSGRAHDGGVALVRLGVIARLEGDLALARRYLEEARADLRAVSAGRWETAVAVAAFGDLAAAEGNEEAARAHYGRIVAEAPEHGFGPGWELGLAGLGLLARRGGDHAHAARLLGALTPAQLTRTRMHAPYAVPPVEAALAASRAALGDDAFEAARRAARTLPLAALAALALEPPIAAGARGHPSPGDAAATPPWASPAARAAGLTPREWEVLALLVTGASNRTIAARLVISPHTAVRHVASVVSKLGAHSRGAAVALSTGLQRADGPDSPTPGVGPGGV